MKTLHQAAEQHTKLAADATARLRKLAATVVAASARDQINKLATTMGDTAVRNAEQGSDKKVQETLQNALALAAGRPTQVSQVNPAEPPKLYTSGIGQDVGAQSSGEKVSVAEEDLAIATGLRVLNHVKMATGISDALTKVACPVHSGDKCGFCGGGNEVIKAASDEVALHIDAVSDLQSSEAINAYAQKCAEGAETAEVAGLAPQAMGAMGMVDSHEMQMKPADPPPIDFGALSVSKNPLVRFIGDNLEG